ncbi:MAG: DUF1385 domain-containing protein [Labilithrix sp.]|nr:DUF1385 domain-containing protein [Labilithrix sp.]MCW5814912.1 DUF1385 domain-containing protein [Labilithrix sp.]
MSDAAPIGTPARPYIGGQAVLEGVMMRAPTSFAIVVRRRDGSLHVRERAMTVGEERKGFAKLPLARGIASLVESLRLGSESLRFSAEQMERDMEAEEAEQARAKAKAGDAAAKATEKGKTTEKGKAAVKTAGSGALNALRAIGYTLFLLTTSEATSGAAPAASSSAEKAAEGDDPYRKNALVVEPPRDEKKGSRAPMTMMLVLMVGFMIALPQAAAAGVNRLLHLNLDVQSPGFQALTGAFKLTIVIGYLLLVRNVFADIRRVFQYHGAEHKTITTYEHNEALTVENAKKHTTLHPRCGTTFLVMVAMVSILVFTAVGGFLPKISTGNAALDNVVFFLEKLPFLPLIAAVTFEIQRFFARHCTTGPLRALLWPGFLCQKITTIEPDDDQLEVALASLRVTLFRESGEDVKSGGDVRYKDFDALMTSPQLRRAA